MEVAPGVHRFGTKLVNWYVVEDAGRLTLVDAGMPGYWRQLEPALREIGAGLDAIDAVVLTHSHVDHTGFAERLRSEGSTRVHVHVDDNGGGGARKLPPLHLYWRPASWPLLAEALRNGLLATPQVRELATFAAGETLPVPGRPTAVHLPGHTAGSCAILLDDRGVVFTGDGLVTLDPYTGAVGPRLMLDGVNEKPAEARASLHRLTGLGTRTVLPGHGEPWNGDMDEAVARALERA